jgi:hypothetical protein
MFPNLTEHAFGVLVLSAEIPAKRHWRWRSEPHRAVEGKREPGRVGKKTLALIGILARALGTEIAGLVPLK